MEKETSSKGKGKRPETPLQIDVDKAQQYGLSKTPEQIKELDQVSTPKTTMTDIIGPETECEIIGRQARQQVREKMVDKMNKSKNKKGKEKEINEPTVAHPSALPPPLFGQGFGRNLRNMVSGRRKKDNRDIQANGPDYNLEAPQQPVQHENNNAWSSQMYPPYSHGWNTNGYVEPAPWDNPMNSEPPYFPVYPNVCYTRDPSRAFPSAASTDLSAFYGPNQNQAMMLGNNAMQPNIVAPYGSPSNPVYIPEGVRIQSMQASFVDSPFVDNFRPSQQSKKAYRKTKFHPTKPKSQRRQESQVDNEQLKKEDKHHVDLVHLAHEETLGRESKEVANKSHEEVLPEEEDEIKVVVPKAGAHGRSSSVPNISFNKVINEEKTNMVKETKYNAENQANIFKLFSKKDKVSAHAEIPHSQPAQKENHPHNQADNKLNNLSSSPSKQTFLELTPDKSSTMPFDLVQHLTTGMDNIGHHLEAKMNHIEETLTRIEATQFALAIKVARIESSQKFIIAKLQQVQNTLDENANKNKNNPVMQSALTGMPPHVPFGSQAVGGDVKDTTQTE